MHIAALPAWSLNYVAVKTGCGREGRDCFAQHLHPLQRTRSAQPSTCKQCRQNRRIDAELESKPRLDAAYGGYC